LQSQQRFRFLQGEQHESLKCFLKAEPAISCDMDGIASNGVFTALPWKHAGSMAAFPYRDYRKFD